MSDTSDKEAGGAGIYKALRVQNAALRAKLAAAEEALRRIGDRRMWRDRDGELVWRGETRRTIEAEDPRDIAAAALRALEGKDG